MRTAYNFGLILLVTAIFFVKPTWACINEYENEGRKGARSKPAPQYATTFGKHTAHDYALELASGHKVVPTDDELSRLSAKAENGDFRDRSNYAIALIRRDRALEALPILEQIAAEQPDEYAAASNLGTAYELTGDNHKALEWIRKGISMNPDAHDGTEWLHVKILEAKIQLADNPQWLQTNSIVGVDFGQDARPTEPQELAKFDGRPIAVVDLQKALEYQLRERMALVASPDEVVADLLTSLGNVLALAQSDEMASEIYALAIRYGAAHVPLRESRFAAVNAGRYYPFFYWCLAGVFVLSICAAVYVFKQSRPAV